MHNKRYIKNELQIKNAFMEVLKTEKRMPTQEEVAQKLGLTRTTVNKHIQGIKLSELVEPFKIFGNDVLIGLRDKAVKGDEKAARLFLMLVFDWKEKSEAEVKLEGGGDFTFKIEYVNAAEKKT